MTKLKGENLFIGAVILVGCVVILFYFGIPILGRWDPDNFITPVAQTVISDKTDMKEIKLIGGE